MFSYLGILFSLKFFIFVNIWLLSLIVLLLLLCLYVLSCKIVFLNTFNFFKSLFAFLSDMLCGENFLIGITILFLIYLPLIFILLGIQGSITLLIYLSVGFFIILSFWQDKSLNIRNLLLFIFCLVLIVIGLYVLKLFLLSKLTVILVQLLLSLLSSLPSSFFFIIIKLFLLFKYPKFFKVISFFPLTHNVTHAESLKVRKKSPWRMAERLKKKRAWSITPKKWFNYVEKNKFGMDLEKGKLLAKGLWTPRNCECRPNCYLQPVWYNVYKQGRWTR